MSSTERLDQQIEAFALYLRDERRASSRTVETYVRDLKGFRGFVAEQGLPLDARKLDVVAIRGFPVEPVPIESSEHHEEEGERDSLVLSISIEARDRRQESRRGDSIPEGAEGPSSLPHGRPGVSGHGGAVQRTTAGLNRFAFATRRSSRRSTALAYESGSWRR